MCQCGFYDRRRHQGARMVRLEQLMKEHKGKIDIGIGQDVLGDHYDIYLNGELCSVRQPLRLRWSSCHRQIDHSLSASWGT